MSNDIRRVEVEVISPPPRRVMNVDEFEVLIASLPGTPFSYRTRSVIDHECTSWTSWQGMEPA